jgi:hypothetical protein
MRGGGMDRQEHIEGLRLDQLTPADIDYFFRTLARRVPRRVNNQQQDLLKRLRGRVRYLGVALGNSTAKQLRPDDLDGACEVMVAQVGQMRRRQWRGKIDGQRKLDFVREQVGEISADLRELAG